MPKKENMSIIFRVRGLASSSPGLVRKSTRGLTIKREQAPMIPTHVSKTTLRTDSEGNPLEILQVKVRNFI